MNPRAVAVLWLLAAVAAGGARASWHEACELEGEVLAAGRDRDSGTGAYRVEVRIDDAAPTPREDGDTDCREYMGMTVDAVVVFPRARVPAPGPLLRFQRTAVDGVDALGGHAGTTVRTRFRALDTTPPAQRSDDE